MVNRNASAGGGRCSVCLSSVFIIRFQDAKGAASRGRGSRSPRGAARWWLAASSSKACSVWGGCTRLHRMRSSWRSARRCHRHHRLRWSEGFSLSHPGKWAGHPETSVPSACQPRPLAMSLPTGPGPSENSLHTAGPSLVITARFGPSDLTCCVLLLFSWSQRRGRCF